MTNSVNFTGDLHVGDLDQWTFTAAAGASLVVNVSEIGGDSDLLSVAPAVRAQRCAGDVCRQHPGGASLRNGAALRRLHGGRLDG